MLKRCFLSYQKRNGFFDVFVTIRHKMTVVDEKQHENEDHDPRHESERRQRTKCRINICDANGT